MSYKLYRSMTETIARMNRKTSKYNKMNWKKLSDVFIAQLFEKFPKIINTMDCIILFDEYCQRITGNNIIFPETKSLVEMLSKAKFSITKDSFKTPYPYQIICFPEGLVIDNVPIHTCLLSYTKIGERDPLFKDFNKKFFPQISVDFDERGSDSPIVSGKNVEYKLTISYPDQTADESPSYIKCTIPDFLIESAMKGPNQLKESIGDYIGFEEAYSLNKKEIKSQYMTMKICCALFVYILVHPEALVSGLPHQKATRSRNFFHEPSGFIIKTPHALKNSPISHYRMGHFRELRNEKFKRNPDGSIRIIEVSDSIIGKQNVTAKTAIDIKVRGIKKVQEEKIETAT